MASIAKLIFQTEHDKSTRPDDFLAEFYQVFWEVIKVYLMAMFYDFLNGKQTCLASILELLTLLPKYQ